MCLLREASSWTLQTNANREEKKKLNENSYASIIIDVGEQGQTNFFHWQP